MESPVYIFVPVSYPEKIVFKANIGQEFGPRGRGFVSLATPALKMYTRDIRLMTVKKLFLGVGRVGPKPRTISFFNSVDQRKCFEK